MTVSNKKRGTNEELQPKPRETTEVTVLWCRTASLGRIYVWLQNIYGESLVSINIEKTYQSEVGDENPNKRILFAS